MKKIIKSIIKKTPGFDNLNLLRFRINYFLKDDETFIRERYKNVFERELNLENPKTFNEKIQWRILKDKKDIYTNLADKYLVREYVKKKIGKEYLVKILGVYEKAEDIDYDKLPNKFVLKCNHDAGSTIICKDKLSFNKKEANKKLNFFLKRNFYYMTREWHYKNIKPLIICEEYIEIFKKDRNENLLPEDYKFHCFKGKIEIIEVQFERYGGKRKINVYDSEWNLLDFIMGYPNADYKIKKPLNFNKTKELSEKLSSDFDYCRVDFYLVEDKIYFGEITFTPCSGLDKYEPIEWDYKLGEMWEIK